MRENKNGPTPTQPTIPAWLAVAMLAFFPLVGIFLMTGSIWLLFSGISAGYPLAFLITFFIIFMSSGIFFILLGWNFFSSFTAKYECTTNGLLAQYPFQRQQLLRWTSFQQVCICYAAYTTNGELRANSVICFVKHGEKKNASMRWKTDNPFRHRSVICIDYTPEFYAQVKTVCPFDIPDLRHTMAYKMYR